MLNYKFNGGPKRTKGPIFMRKLSHYWGLRCTSLLYGSDRHTLLYKTTIHLRNEYLSHTSAFLTQITERNKRKEINRRKKNERKTRKKESSDKREREKKIAMQPPKQNSREGRSTSFVSLVSELYRTLALLGGKRVARVLGRCG